ncbi:MAG: desulfoferrodoxin [Nanoarchaeota archaeon]|nr:desulfoferrodoxin [Nanoarchaeota archaeon]MBU1030152.1 desulfoferrodoxin [Nanoarchaeota archaeon]MBU1850428.1 desulfoferrodoxin [Nanoarchaeota archaeon]
MTQKGEIYKCEICGNVVSVVDNGAGELVCCGEPMVLQEEKSVEAEGKEKHVPILEVDGSKVVVTVGSVNHPMEDKHYIQLIELLKDGVVVASKNLKPADAPKAEFILEDADGLKARAYCNIHGLWIN